MGNLTEAKALDDFVTHAGQVLRVTHLMGYDYKGDFVDVVCDPPVAVRVFQHYLQHDLFRWQDGYLDPYWMVAVLQPQHPALRKRPIVRCLVDGPSYNPLGHKLPLASWRLETWTEWFRRVILRQL